MATFPEGSDTEIWWLNRQAASLTQTRKLSAEQMKLAAYLWFSPWLLLAQGSITGAALLGAGVALAKLSLT